MPNKPGPASALRHEVPEGRKAKEFLNDAQLLEFHEDILAAAPADHPDLDALVYNVKMARRAAALTAEGIAEAEAEAAADAAKE